MLLGYRNVTLVGNDLLTFCAEDIVIERLRVFAERVFSALGKDEVEVTLKLIAAVFNGINVDSHGTIIANRLIRNSRKFFFIERTVGYIAYRRVIFFDGGYNSTRGIILGNDVVVRRLVLVD